MTIKCKIGTAWVDVDPGDLRISTGSSWNIPYNVYVKSNGFWLDSEYEATVGKPFNLELINGSTTFLKIAWNFPVTGVRPTSYTIRLYNQMGSAYIGTTLPERDVLSNTVPGTCEFVFSDSTFIFNETNYYAVVTGNVDGFISTSSDPLFIRTGKPAVTHEEWEGDWSTTEQLVRPTFTSATSTLSPYTGNLAVDTLPGVEMWATTWKSTTRTAQNAARPNTLWEALEFTLPATNSLLVGVTVVCPPQQDIYVGLNVKLQEDPVASWIGNYPPTTAGIDIFSLTGTYNTLLSHDYYLRDISRQNPLKTLRFPIDPVIPGDVGIPFQYVKKISVAISNFTSDNGWRAWLQDFVLIYRAWNPQARRITVIDENEVFPVAGPDAWSPAPTGIGTAYVPTIRTVPSPQPPVITATSAVYTPTIRKT